MKHHSISMTEGSLWRNIFFYSLPLMFSNLLQILFNLADVAVIGRFAGSLALGSVGSTTLLIALTTGVPMGIGGGINAVTALHVGAKHEKEIRRCVHTSFLLSLAIGFALLLCGLFLSRPALNLIGTKDELIDGAVRYLTIYLLGSPALAIYNFGNAVLSAVGDTGRPLKYMVTAGIINVILNLFFVLVLGMSVAGVALASIISQYVSAFLILRHLIRCGEVYGLTRSHMGFRPELARQVLAIGVPLTIQYSLFSIANLFIQSAVNSFDHVVVEGNSAAANADNLVYDIMAAFYTACTSFMAQNRGAGKPDRVKKTYGITLLYSGVAAVILGGLLVLFRVPFLRLFTTDEAVIGYGKIRLFIMGCSYFISAFMDDAAAAARGLGKSVIPTVIVILGSVVYRIIWVLTVFAYYRTLPSLYLVYATAWTFTSILANAYLAYCLRRYLRSVSAPAAE